MKKCIKVVDVDRVLKGEFNAGNQSSFSLAAHRRCACHLLNLIASSDLDCVVMSGGNCGTLYQSTFEKIRKLCKKQNKSPKSFENV